MPLPRCRIPILTVAGLMEIAALQEARVPKLSRPYKTIDEAALGGFKKIVISDLDYKNYEYGFSCR